jgi:hypothetical protein
MIYQVSASGVTQSAIAVGPHARASAGSPPDPSGEALALVDALLRGIVDHWPELAEADLARRYLREVRSELRDPEPDHGSIRFKLASVLRSVAPVATLADLANSIVDLVSHLH